MVVLDISSGPEELGGVRPPLVLALFVLCLLVFICLSKGVNSLKWVRKMAVQPVIDLFETLSKLGTIRTG